jgi:hypothetical protein
VCDGVGGVVDLYRGESAWKLRGTDCWLSCVPPGFFPPETNLMDHFGSDGMLGLIYLDIILAEAESGGKTSLVEVEGERYPWLCFRKDRGGEGSRCESCKVSSTSRRILELMRDFLIFI